MSTILAPADLFRALADETRLRCVMLLQQHRELCVCELTHALALAQPKISRHLTTLKAVKVVCDRREGVWIFYRLHPELPAWAKAVLRATAKGLCEQEPFCLDQQTLITMSKRPKVCHVATHKNGMN